MLKNAILWSAVFADWFVGLKRKHWSVKNNVVTQVYMELVLSSILVIGFCDRLNWPSERLVLNDFQFPFPFTLSYVHIYIVFCIKPVAAGMLPFLLEQIVQNPIKKVQVRHRFLQKNNNNKDKSHETRFAASFKYKHTLCNQAEPTTENIMLDIDEAMLG